MLARFKIGDTVRTLSNTERVSKQLQGQVFTVRGVSSGYLGKPTYDMEEGYVWSEDQLEAKAVNTSPDFSEGDLVEAVKGETVIRGRLEDKYLSRLISETGWPVDSLKSKGFTVTLIESAANRLPTEPGMYIDKDDDYWYLKADGDWVCLSQYGEFDVDESYDAKNFVPFTRLIPEAKND